MPFDDSLDESDCHAKKVNKITSSSVRSVGVAGKSAGPGKLFHVTLLNISSGKYSVDNIQWISIGIRWLDIQTIASKFKLVDKFENRYLLPKERMVSSGFDWKKSRPLPVGNLSKLTYFIRVREREGEPSNELLLLIAGPIKIYNSNLLSRLGVVSLKHDSVEDRRWKDYLDKKRKFFVFF